MCGTCRNIYLPTISYENDDTSLIMAVANKRINTVIKIMLDGTLYHNDECSILKYQCFTVMYNSERQQG